MVRLHVGMMNLFLLVRIIIGNLLLIVTANFLVLLAVAQITLKA